MDGRSLTLLADGPGVTIVGTLTVRNLDETQRVVLRGFTLGYPGSLELYDNDGVVHVEDCVILADQQSGAGQYAGLLAVESRLVLARSTVMGSMNYAFHDTPPTPGLQATGSQLVLLGSAIRGGEGTDPYAASVTGAAGLWLDDSSLTAQGCNVAGGFGDTASGGTGLVALNASNVHLLDSSIAGGGGTPAGITMSLDGTSTLATLPGAAHALLGDSPVREGEPLSIAAQGLPGDAVWLAVSLSPDWLPTAGGHFALTVGAPFQLVPLGFVGPSGEISLTAPAPALPAAAVELFLQDLYLDAWTGLKVLGPSTAVTLVDSAF